MDLYDKPNPVYQWLYQEINKCIGSDSIDFVQTVIKQADETILIALLKLYYIGITNFETA